MYITLLKRGMSQHPITRELLLKECAPICKHIWIFEEGEEQKTTLLISSKILLLVIQSNKIL